MDKTINGRNTIVGLDGCNGDKIIIAGPEAGDDGFFLADTGLKGIYDPTVKVVYEEPGNWPGARYLSHRVLRRDIVIPIYVLEDDEESWAYRDSRLRMMLDYDQDAVLWVQHPEYKRRNLKVRLGQDYDVDLTVDPNIGAVQQAVIHLISGDPFWYEEDDVYSATTVTDTTFDPTPLPWPWPKEDLPTEDLYITVKKANPTDQKVFPKWTVPGSTFPPSKPYIPAIPWLGAPTSEATTWTIPDYNMDIENYPENGDADRRLVMPSLIGGLRTNEVQVYALTGDAHPTGGYYNILFDGETSANLVYNATAAQVKSALESMPNVSVNDIDVTMGQPTSEVQQYYISGGPTGGTYKLIFDGQATRNIDPSAGPADVKLALGLLPNLIYWDVDVQATKSTDEVQELQFLGEPSGGTFTITLNGETTDPIPWDASDLTIENRLTALPSLAAFQVHVDSQLFDRWSPIVLTFHGGNVSGVNMNEVTVDASELTGGADVGMSVSTYTQGGQTYTLTFNGQQKGINVPALTADASGLIGGVSPGIAVTTTVQGKQPYILTFQNLLSGVDVPQITLDLSHLTGGSNVGYEVTTTTEGYTYPAENAVIDSDPRVEQVKSESGSSLWARMNGVRFRNYIPKWTGEVVFKLTVSGAVVGQVATLRIPRPFSRPWGVRK